MGRKRIAILGSTGSIGVSTLEILERHRDRFEVVGLAAWGNTEVLKEQILMYRPKVACIMDDEKADELKGESSIAGTGVVCGTDGLIEVATCREADMVVSAIVGAAGLIPTFAAVEAGKDLALANKETLVAAGSIVMREAAEKGCKIFPVDSEHSAIFQSLLGHRKEDVKRLILTASGGPFLRRGKEYLKSVTAGDALNHPTWDMGSKITIDSATLMNKGLEVIEARWLFDLPSERIDVIIHPQSIVHSMVEYRDGSVISQMGVPDMKGPIAYALSYPERLDPGTRTLDLGSVGKLTFEEPDTERFPALGLCYEALEMSGTAPAVLSAANEVAVDAFLDERIGFTDMPLVMKKVLDDHAPVDAESIEEVLKADIWGRKRAREEIEKLTAKCFQKLEKRCVT